MAPVASSNLNWPPVQTYDLRRKHVEEHWWGKHQDASGAWVEQGDYDAATNPTTGFWMHWYGDAEGIFRETMIRALCVSLGIPRGEADSRSNIRKLTKKPAWYRGGRQWPISILWKCPEPWYEGWIEWKDYGVAGNKSGHVTVVLSTPSHGVKLYDTPIRPPDAPTVVNDPYHAYQLNPDEPAGPEGMWVVSQVLNKPLAYGKPQPTPPGDWSPPTLGLPVYSAGSVITVSPATPDGGAAPNGMPLI
jgi:hypothetical protein